MKIVGPGELIWRVVRAAWCFVRRRPVLAAWLGVVVSMIVVPCLYCYEYGPASSHVVWLVSEGSIGRADLTHHRYRSPATHQFWRQPGIDGLWSFNFEWSYPGKSVNRPPYWVEFPVWVVPAIPTVLIGAPMFIRNHRKRGREKHAARDGRTPCPACGYDATGLPTCPECGAGIEPA